MAKAAPYKVKIVDELCNLFSQYPIIGVVNMENLPAPQLQKMKKQLRDKIVLYMTKRRLMKIAIEKTKDKVKGLDKLTPNLVGMPALIFTKENPFRLYKTLKNNKSKAPAKPGQIAPKELIVHAGPTPFAPGPIIGELSIIGIKSGVESGKVVIKNDSIVARQGEKIKPKVAEILTRLGIEPMDIGLDLVATLENGTLYLKDILDIDEEKLISDLASSGRAALNLSLFASYPNKENINLLLSNAHNDAKSIGLSQNIIDGEIIEILLAKAHSQFDSLKSATKFETIDKVVKKKEVGEKEKSEQPQKVAIVTKKEGKEPDEKKPRREIKPEPKLVIIEKPKPEDKKVEPEILKSKPLAFEKQETDKKFVEIPEERKAKVEKPELKKDNAKYKTMPLTKEIKVSKDKISRDETTAEEDKTTEEKVKELVKQTKEKAEGKKITAEQLIQEIKKEQVTTEKKEAGRVPTAQELAKLKEKKSVEDLTKELTKKGTLRK